MTDLLSFFVTAQRNSEKSGMHKRRWFTSITMEREKLGTSRQYWLADSRFLALVIFYGSLPLSAATQRQ
jgi:hypothetical protein